MSPLALFLWGLAAGGAVVAVGIAVALALVVVGAARNEVERDKK